MPRKLIVDTTLPPQQFQRTLMKAAAQADKLFKVTYFNAELGKQCVLIDNIDSTTALAVLAKFGDRRNQFHYMGPQTRIEPMQEAA